GVEHPRVVARVLLAGERVQLATDRVQGGRDLQGGAPAGALEQQVLKVVSGPSVGEILVARADARPDAERGRPHGGQLLGDDRPPAGQARAGYGRAAVGRSAPGPCSGRRRWGGGVGGPSLPPPCPPRSRSRS